MEVIEKEIKALKEKIIKEYPSLCMKLRDMRVVSPIYVREGKIYLSDREIEWYDKKAQLSALKYVDGMLKYHHPKEEYYTINNSQRKFDSILEVNKYLEDKFGCFTVHKHIIEPVHYVEKKMIVDQSEFIDKFIHTAIDAASFWISVDVDDIGLTDKNLRDFYPWDSQSNVGRATMASKCLWLIFICMLYEGYPTHDAKIKTWEDGRGMCFIFPNIRDFISKAKKKKFDFLPQNLNVVPIRIKHHGLCHSFRVISDKNVQKYYTKDADVTSVKFQQDFTYAMNGAPRNCW